MARVQFLNSLAALGPIEEDHGPGSYLAFSGATREEIDALIAFLYRIKKRDCSIVFSASYKIAIGEEAQPNYNENTEDLELGTEEAPHLIESLAANANKYDGGGSIVGSVPLTSEWEMIGPEVVTTPERMRAGEYVIEPPAGSFIGPVGVTAGHSIDSMGVRTDAPAGTVDDFVFSFLYQDGSDFEEPLPFLLDNVEDDAIALRATFNVIAGNGRYLISSRQAPGYSGCGTITITVPAWPDPDGPPHTIEVPLYGNTLNLSYLNDELQQVIEIQTMALAITITPSEIGGSLQYGYDPADPNAGTTMNPVWNEDGSMVLNPRTASLDGP